ncbi:putative Kinase [Melia azedarach]|uniref:Kinase n=1 Tax=Melia azedarach TaxID=155640 RepID=A0ACC1YQM7_MELAZ|nr:putative Kinase [Melia azedarach]
MGAALISCHFRQFFIVSLISLALAEAEDQFIYHGFNESKLHLDGLAKIHPNGLLQLTNGSELKNGHAFFPFPFKFNTSSSKSLSFSTNFVFAIVPVNDSGGHGMAFVISPYIDFSTASSTEYLGLLNRKNNGLSTNHIIAVELDTVQTVDFNETNGNHVAIDLNDLLSNESSPAAYFSKEGKNISLNLQSGKRIQIWIDYDGEEKLLNVTLAPIMIPKPYKPLLSTPLDLSQMILDSMYIGFSASTGTIISNHYILGWSFNRGGQAQNLDISKLPPLPPRRKASKKPGQIVIVLLVAIGVVLTTIITAIYIVTKRKYEEIYEDWEREYSPHRFSYKNLYKATKVKRVSHNSNEGMKQFLAEIVSMRRLRHRNLVQLLGYCRRRGELLLVYDYMPNGSLDKILHGNKKPNLNWFQRFRIIRGVASGLLYLHEEWEQVVLHRDIKPGNVLLDSDLNGKLGDFGLARLYDHGSIPQTTNLVGTVGYMAPELMRTGKAGTSTDIYAFGVFMLEVASGRRPIEQQEETETINLVDWVIDCWKRGVILNATDPRLEGLYVEEQMEKVLQLGLFCSLPNPAARPSMRQVMQYLDGDAKFSDNNLIDLFRATNEVSNVGISFPSLSEGSSASAHTVSTIDSVLIVGR